MVKLVGKSQLDVIPKQMKHRASLPPWITLGTSKITRKLKSLEPKQLSSFSLKRAQKINDWSSNAKSQAATDQMLYEKDVFKTRNFDQFFHYFEKIRCPVKMPHRMYLQNQKIETDLDKANMFNNWFASVYSEKQEPGDPFPLTLSSQNSLVSNVTFSVEIIEKILSMLNVNKACGAYKIPNILLKNGSKSFAPSIHFCLGPSTTSESFHPKRSSR